MVMSQLWDWKLLPAPSTRFCHIPDPWTTSSVVLNGKEMQVCAGRTQPWSSQ